MATLLKVFVYFKCFLFLSNNTKHYNFFSRNQPAFTNMEVSMLCMVLGMLVCMTLGTHAVIPTGKKHYANFSSIFKFDNIFRILLQTLCI